MEPSASIVGGIGKTVQAGARQQLDFPAIDTGMHAIAVVLDLVQPAIARRRVAMRVSCGLIHLGGRSVLPTAASAANLDWCGKPEVPY